MKIICVIVTYNRKDLLKKSLDAVLKEGIKKENIILVDNNSNDGTKELIEKKYGDKLQYFLLSENTGGAGGFSYGLEIAYNQGGDFFLLFDDDVEMIPGAIDNYIKYIDKGDIIIGRRKNIDGSDFEYGHNLDINTGSGKKITEFDKNLFIKEEFIEINAVTFEGVFFSRKVIDKIGLPEKDFFIQLDDAWFGLKAILNGFKIIYIKDYTFIRLLTSKFLSVSSLYYYIRNRFLLNKLLNSILDKKVNHTISIIKTCIYFFISILIRQDKKITYLYALLKGFKDGIMGKFGK